MKSQLSSRACIIHGWIHPLITLAKSPTEKPKAGVILGFPLEVSTYGRRPREQSRYHNARSIGIEISASGLAPRAQGYMRGIVAVPKAHSDQRHRTCQ